MLLWLRNLGQAGGGYDVGHFGDAIDEDMSPFYLKKWQEMVNRGKQSNKKLVKLENKLVSANRIEKVEPKHEEKVKEELKPTVAVFDNTLILQIEADIARLEEAIEDEARREVQRMIREEEAVLVLLLDCV